MAQEFAKKFYQSSQWKSCRRSYIAKVHGLCERCLAKGKLTPGWIIHHKILLTPSNILDPEITLNHDNLEMLCLDCHNEEHLGSPATREDVAFSEDGDLISI